MNGALWFIKVGDRYQTMQQIKESPSPRMAMFGACRDPDMPRVRTLQSWEDGSIIELGDEEFWERLSPKQKFVSTISFTEEELAGPGLDVKFKKIT